MASCILEPIVIYSQIDACYANVPQKYIFDIYTILLEEI